MPRGKQSSKNKVKERAFYNEFDSKIGRERADKPEGKPAVGALTKNEEFSKLMSMSNSEFRQRSDIEAMRNRAQEFRKKAMDQETPEQRARRLRRQAQSRQ